MNAAPVAMCMTRHLDVMGAQEKVDPVTTCMTRHKAIPITAYIPAQPLKTFPKTGFVRYAANLKANLKKKRNPFAPDL